MKSLKPSFGGLECQHMNMCVCVLSHFSCVKLCDPMDYNPPVSLSMGFSKQEYWSEFPRPPPGNLPDSGIKPMFPVAPALPVDSLPLSHRGSSYKFGRGLEGCRHSDLCPHSMSNLAVAVAVVAMSYRHSFQQLWQL